MSDELQELTDWAGAMLQQLSTGQRRQLNRDIARDLRVSQQKRITAQKNPDGSAYEARRPQKDLQGKKGSLRRKMFTRLRLVKYLQSEASANSAQVGYLRGGLVGYIARVHQDGRRDRVSRRGPYIQYPERRLLGFTASDRGMVRDRILTHLAQ